MAGVLQKISITLSVWTVAEIDKRDVGRGRSETISRLLRRYIVLVSRPDMQRLTEAVVADRQDQQEATEVEKEGQENE